MEMVQNPSQSLFYDALAMSTSETGLIDRDHYKCPAVTKQAKEYHMKALLNTSSSLSSPPSSFLDVFVLKCPSSTQLEGVLNLSLSLEADIFPEFVATNPSSPCSNNNSNILKEHQENFWKQASKHKFCWLNGTATLQMVEWKEFFQKFSPFNKLGMELEWKKKTIE